MVFPIRNCIKIVFTLSFGSNFISLTENNHRNSELFRRLFDRDGIKSDLKMRCKNAILFLGEPLEYEYPRRLRRILTVAQFGED